MTEFLAVVSADLRARRKHAGAWGGFFLVLSFRVAQLCRGRGQRPRVASMPVGLLYKAIVQWLLNFELPWGTEVGCGLVVHHGRGIVVNSGTVFGKGVVLRHNVTVGNRRSGGRAPVVGDQVEFGVGCCVLGPIAVGEGARIGPLVLVLDDVPAFAVVLPSPPVVEVRGRIPAGDSSREHQGSE